MSTEYPLVFRPRSAQQGAPAERELQPLRTVRAALVSMPFTSAFRPSIQLGLLKAIGESRQFAVDTFHLNLDFARLIGIELFEQLCEMRLRLDGDWLFAKEAFEDLTPDQDEGYIAEFAEGISELTQKANKSLNDFRTIRRVVVPQYLDYLMKVVKWSDYDVVGFTSTFQQNVASFALARRIKAACPRLVTLFGGSNFDGAMGREYVRSIEAVDYVVTGEGDDAFPEFLTALAHGDDPANVPGVIGKGHGMESAMKLRPLFQRVDELPTPDYGEYFERGRALGVFDRTSEQSIGIPFESSRGCWWGEKQHCVFCGLNGAAMEYRKKPAVKVIAELSELSRRHRSFRFLAVDNILATNYFDEFLDRITHEKHDFQLFYEVKSNLTRDKIRRMQRAGVRWVQPGIESLNTHVLKLMRKGVSGIRNVNTLRWILYYGISAAWNLLWGFPGERAEDYEAQAKLLPHLFHLQPPVGAGPIWMERFSPVFADPDSFPRQFAAPIKSYSYVYPKAVNLAEIAYYFDHRLEGTLPDDIFEETERCVAAWQERWGSRVKPSLTFRASRDLVLVEDTRTDSRRHELVGPAARLYVGCSDEPRTASQLARELRLDMALGEIEVALRKFVTDGIAMHEGALFLSLALPATPGR